MATWCPYCHQTQGTHDEDCPCRNCMTQCDDPATCHESEGDDAA